MKTYINPSKDQWIDLSKRPVDHPTELTDKVLSILKNIRTNGDAALFDYSKQFDGVELDNLKVSQEEIDQSETKVSESLKEAISQAYQNIYHFHKAQETAPEIIRSTPGVKSWRKSVAIDRVGLYIPGGSAPLFSTLLMLGIPAKIAGCEQIVVCTPPNKQQEIHPAILYTAKILGITDIFKTGGAQAIAAMGMGTETIPSVLKIFGPGNQYVTKAKELIQQMGIAIDMPAGPSEVLIIADESCDPSFVAADLLSQAEHGADSQVILLSDQKKVLEECLSEIKKQTKSLPRKEIVEQSLGQSKAICFNNLDTCFEFSNQYAPEHLIIATKHAAQLANTVRNAGSVFIGNYSCEAAGDYASGTNHTLPTNGFAKTYSGVSLDSFVKKITFQEISALGIQNIGKTIEVMAEAEELFAHKNAVTLRLNQIKNV